MIEFVRRWLGDKVADEVGPPTGKTGNEWMEDDFAGSDSELAIQGGAEFIDYCVTAGSCEIAGDVLEKFKEVLAKYPVADSEEFLHFSVVVRQGLIRSGMLPDGDPERYQYKVSALCVALATQ